MASNSNEIIIPRPGATLSTSKKPIPAPTEAAFTATFGTLLPPAQYLDTGNGKAAYYELPPSSSVNGTAVPDRVLLIHGVQTPALGMLPLARKLRSSFPSTHFVLLDLWGHGLSETPLVPYEPSLFHSLLDALLDRLNWASAHLIGFSFGGATTAGYAALRPSRVQSFALVAPAGLLRSSDFTAEQQAHLRGDDETQARQWVISLLEGGELIVPDDWQQRVSRGEIVAEALRDWQMKHHSGHAASVVAMFRDGGVMDLHDAFVKAAKTGIPNCAVLGELDDLCSVGQLHALGFADVSVVPGVGHGVVRERVPEVAKLIGGFWKRLDVSSSG